MKEHWKDAEANALAERIKQMYGAEPEFVFKDDFVDAIWRHGLNRKWFALIMQIPAKKLGLDRAGDVFIVNLKGDPMLIDDAVDGEHFFRAYHMNKTHWITALLSEGLDRDKFNLLLDMSFNLTR